MGCDIHAHLEVKLNGGWHYLTPVDFERDYALFARMADVRNSYQGRREIEPISKPRGLPSDAAFMTVFHSDVYGSDGHSHSWLSYDEICGLIAWDKERGDVGQLDEWRLLKCSRHGVWLFGNSIYYWREYPDDYPKELEDVRLCYWFDN